MQIRITCMGGDLQDLREWTTTPDGTMPNDGLSLNREDTLRVRERNHNFWKFLHSQRRAPTRQHMQIL